MTTKLPSAQVIEMVLLKGDLSALTEEQRLLYYNNVCASLGLNPLTKPFEYIPLSGKLVLYAKRDATDQLRKLHNISVLITDREMLNEYCIVTARASTPSGRTDESTGVVQVGHLKGLDYANALLKCETKAKRRVTLSICGLGMLDETEVEDTPRTGNRAQVSFSEDEVGMPKVLSARSEPEPDDESLREVSKPLIPTCCDLLMMKSVYHEGNWYCTKCKKMRPIV